MEYNQHTVKCKIAVVNVRRKNKTIAKYYAGRNRSGMSKEQKTSKINNANRKIAEMLHFIIFNGTSKVEMMNYIQKSKETI